MTSTLPFPRAPSRLADAGRAARQGGDWLWSGLGVGAATASAGFAAYALAFSSGEVVPSGNFTVFAGRDHLYQAAAQRTGPPAGTPAADPRPAPPPAELAEAAAVDFTPTGTLHERAAGDHGAGEAARGRSGPEPRRLTNFTLRDVFDGKALVESHSNLSVVKPGSVLDGAGEVLSIERRDDHWVVLTANGIIAGQRR